jgi:toxin HigB-1
MTRDAIRFGGQRGWRSGGQAGLGVTFCLSYGSDLDTRIILRYIMIMIINSKGKIAASAMKGEFSKGFPSDLIKRTRAMLTALNAAVVLSDLRFPPGNHLEELKGNRVGQHSVRINDQWRICFVWTANGPCDVEIVDYH